MILKYESSFFAYLRKQGLLVVFRKGKKIKNDGNNGNNGNNGMICTLFTGQTSKEGIFMRYSYEYKRKCVDMYRQGQWPDTPNDVSQKHFRCMIQEWVKMEDANGPQVLKHKSSNKI